MAKLQKMQFEKIVDTIGDLVRVDDAKARKNLIHRLSTMHENDAVDHLLILLFDLIKNNRLKIQEAFCVIDLIAADSNQYSTRDVLIERLQWLKKMNLIHTKMPLTENHKLVVEMFDRFNQVIGTDFDAYYTGGLMGYLGTNHQLERYHSDLDLFINEAQLPALYERIKQNPDFCFASNLDDKDHTGHEFKINYKGTPMSIGLLLFERKPKQIVVLKSYYHADCNPQKELLVDEKCLAPAYAQIIFPENKIQMHNRIPYRMASLESIYQSKKGSRPKDKYDAQIMHDSVDLSVVEILEKAQVDNYKIDHQKVEQPFILEFNQQIKSQNQTSERCK